MAYVDYEYYKDTFKGSMVSDDFIKQERKAELLLNKETFGNITTSTIITDGIKMCICELADYLHMSEMESRNQNVTSEKVGEYSVSYVSQAERDSLFSKKVRETVKLYLNNPDDSPLLYRGC